MPPALRTRRTRLTVAVAALLLGVEALAGAAAGLAHARELVAGPAAIEAEHGRACVVQHDPARCSACGTAGVATLSQPDRAAPAADPAVQGSFWHARPVPAGASFHPAAPPRAPPTLSD